MVTGVEFEEDKVNYGAMHSSARVAGVPASFSAGSSRSGGLAGWLITHGWAKSDRSAQGILIGIVIVNIIITYIVIKYFL